MAPVLDRHRGHGAGLSRPIASAVDFLERLESITYDWRVRQAATYPTTIATNLGFVNINENSITAVNNGSLDFQYGLYWPRHIYGRLVRELKTEGARITAFDILFDNRAPSRSPCRDRHDRCHDAPWFRRIFRGTVRLREAGNVILAADTGCAATR